MPFPLAHPAAILPFKRYCPRFLSLAGLVVGSVVPDAGYVVEKVGDFSHTFAGSFGFSLPAGLVMLGLFYALRQPVVERLPERHRKIFLPLCRQPVASPLIMVISVLIGAWTHLLWDSFTHKKGWLVIHLPLLQMPVAGVANHRLLVCNVLWYVCSFCGVALLCFVYECWRETVDPSASPASDKMRLRNALFVGLLAVPIELLHHQFQSAIGSAAVGVGSLALIIGVVLALPNPPDVRPQKES